ncbi:MAG: AgmX/PglI C-terminal domain-containing protein [Deltaproteobacteria bacterium]|nr:AgmX/PglI C-terminal domain-containing protein [Deltaproteobacteria bacterium]
MIPGEEAPTDPGEVVKKAQTRADDKVRQRRALAPMWLAIPLVGLVCAVAGFYTLSPDPELVPIVFDEELDMDTVEVAYLEAPAAAPAGPAPVASAPRPKPRPTSEPSRTTNPTPEPELIAPPRPKSGGFGVDQSVGRRAGPLTDPDQIRDMVFARMTAQSGKLKACYEERLKTLNTLSGRWLVSFTVAPNDTVANPAAKGATVSDAEFETCLVRELGRWAFDPISRDQPVQRTLKFTPD